MRALLMLLALLMAAPAPAAPLAFGPFGELVLRGRQADPAMVAIILSDGSGWGAVEEEMAGIAAHAGALVVGVDLKRYFGRIAEKDYEPNVSYELESMSKYVQKNLGLARLDVPILIGHGDGGAVVYASLVQAPAGTFRAGVSLGFRPDIAVARPFGIGRGLTWTRDGGKIRYDAFTKHELPWTLIQAEDNEGFALAATQDFLRGIRGMSLTVLPGVRDYADAAPWRGALEKALAAAAPGAGDPAPAPGGVEDLPLVELPATGPGTDTLAVFVSGDGGWAGIDKDIGAILARSGIGVVGLDSMKYFWTRRTPEGAGADLARIMRHYCGAWGKTRVVLIGFSLGADALPPMINNLPDGLRRTVRQVTLLAPSKFVELEFHVSDWIHDNEAEQDIALLPEVRRLSPIPVLCLYGLEEKSSLGPDLAPSEATVIALPGSHHFGGDYAGVAARILEHLREF